MPLPSSVPSAPRAATPASRPRRGSRRKQIVLLVSMVLVLLVCGAVAIKMTMFRTERTSAPHAQADPQLASARIDADSEASHGGWVGVQELLAERATVTLVTYADESKVARDFAAEVDEPVSLASLAIDNSAGSREVIVDPAGAAIKLIDGRGKAPPVPAQVLSTVRSNPEANRVAIMPPFVCTPGSKMTGKLLLLPRGTDPHKVVSILIRINGQPYEVVGSFSADGKKVESLRTGQPVSPAPVSPAPQEAPASRPASP